MNRKEQKTATDTQILIDFIETYAEFCVNLNTGRGTDRLYKHWTDLDKELLKREIFTQEQIDRFHA